MATRLLGDRLILCAPFVFPELWDGTPGHLADLLTDCVHASFPVQEHNISKTRIPPDTNRRESIGNWFLLEATTTLHPYTNTETKNESAEKQAHWFLAVAVKELETRSPTTTVCRSVG